MTLNDFLEYVKTRKALDTEEIHRFLLCSGRGEGVALRTFRKTRAALASRVPAVLYGFRKEY